MRKAFIVVDMIYDFVADDGALTCGEPSQAIVDDIVQGIHETIQNGGYVYLCGDTHEPDDPEFQVWPVHAVKGTKGAEWVAPTQQTYEQYKDTGRIHIVNKTKYDAFFHTPLEQLLEEHKISEVDVAGVCTSICVNLTVQAATFRGYPVTVKRSRVADFEQKKHDIFLEHMEAICKAKIEN